MPSLLLLSNASAGGVQHARSLPVGRVLVDGQGEQRRIDVFAQVLERTGAGIGSRTGDAAAAMPAI